MPLHSMTGFARADGAGDGFAWVWEIRSVNGRGLDVRVRTPAGFEFVEIPARGRIGARLGRGNVQASLAVQGDVMDQRLEVNEQALDHLKTAVDILNQRFHLTPPTAGDLLALRGVLQTPAGGLPFEQREATAEALLTGLDSALEALVAERRREGDAMAGLLAQRLEELEDLVATAEASPARNPEAIRERLERNLADLIGAASDLDPARLHQEAVLLATKADIREELDRLAAHIDAARALLDASEPTGRRLDFLSQEINREVNTLCAKSTDLALTETGLAMKAVVDQFREQIQNVE